MEADLTEERWDKNVTFLIYLSIFVGSSLVFFQEPFEGYAHYIVYLMLLPSFVSRYGLPKTPFQILIFPLVVGVFQIMLGNNDPYMFFKIFGGVFLSVTFYHYVIEYYEFDIEKMFSLYLKWIYWASVIAIIQFVCYKINFQPGYDFSWLLNKGGNNISNEEDVIRISSFFVEPSQLGIMLGPAVFVSITNIIRRKNYYYQNHQNIIILIALYLSRSSTGYIGLFFGLIILGINLGNLIYLAVFLMLGFLGGLGLYNTVDEFKRRVDTSLGLWVDSDFDIKNVNTSSFVLFNNAHVAYTNLQEHPFFGTGLGSHPIAYDKYSYTKSIVKVKGIESNKKDANSLLLRLMSETGLLGILAIFFLIFKCFVSNDNTDDEHWIISGGLLVIMLLYMLRQGNYFLNGFPFFVWLYYYTRVSYVKKVSENIETDTSLANA